MLNNRAHAAFDAAESYINLASDLIISAFEDYSKLTTQKFPDYQSIKEITEELKSEGFINLLQNVMPNVEVNASNVMDFAKNYRRTNYENAMERNA